MSSVFSLFQEKFSNIIANANVMKLAISCLHLSMVLDDKCTFRAVLKENSNFELLIKTKNVLKLDLFETIKVRNFKHDE